MIPIGDDDSSRRTLPMVTYTLVALNILFFFVELSAGNAFVGTWALVPSRFLANPLGGVLTLFSGIGSIADTAHLGGFVTGFALTFLLCRSGGAQAAA